MGITNRALRGKAGVMGDIECPYCMAEFDIDHDDGHGTQEGTTYEEQCPECEKYFVFYTSISWSYEGHKADCLNGSEHNLEKMNIHPNFWPDAVRCKDCDYENRGSPDKKAQDEYFKKDSQ